ncbi:hypothetical protein XENOCAPTIV_001169 [Xenoophorus captivus]|uniref:PHD-type domain-containing protein n=1 Tax=Xenoophorus captivus TaxID=1517983 RepID=A0ABV0QLL5_9TELE
MLGTLTAVPIKVPQVSSLHRLAGQAATVLPQVRPKTQIPDSLPHSPCQELQPLSLQRVTAVVSPKSQAPTLPTANSTFSSEHQPNSQNNASTPLLAPSLGPDLGSPSQHASAGPGVAYAIIAASPAPGNGVSAVSEAVKVIIIQPQAPSSIEGSPGAQADFPLQEAPTAKSPPKKKKEEDPEKIAFMVALGLVTTEQLEDEEAGEEEEKHSQPSLQWPLRAGGEKTIENFSKHQLVLGWFSCNQTSCLCAEETPAVTLSEQLPLPEELEHDDRCAVCKEEGELQPCHNCPRAYHPSCLHPPIKSPHRGPWYCPKCQKKCVCAVRQEEKRRLLRRNNELKKECSHLEEQDQKLNKTLKVKTPTGLEDEVSSRKKLSLYRSFSKY